jgi:hypothetical protein
MRSWRFPTYSTVQNNNPGKACDAVEVSVSYQYTPRVPLIRARMAPSMNLTGRQRFVSEPFQACTAN